VKLMNTERQSRVIWEVNEVAAKAPVTDDPDEFFGHLELDVDTDGYGELDDHSRFLIGDWPRSA
jgi:hypothetical protein